MFSFFLQCPEHIVCRLVHHVFCCCDLLVLERESVRMCVCPQDSKFPLVRWSMTSKMSWGPVEIRMDQYFFQEASNKVLLECTGRHTDSAVTVSLGTSELIYIYIFLRGSFLRAL